MARLADVLTSIEASCNTMNSLDFGPPGIFTNAIINKPDVTSLIRDPSEAESSLYKIQRGSGLGGSTLRRKDGQDNADKLVDFVPQRVDEQRVYEKVDGGPNSAVVQVPRLVDVPDDDKLANLEALSSPTKRRLISRYKLVPQDVLESEDFNTILATTHEVVSKYPNIVNDSDINATLESIKKEHDKLLEETEALERAVQRQKEELGAQGDGVFQLESPGRDVDEMIRAEERIIQNLEEELEAARA